MSARRAARPFPTLALVVAAGLASPALADHVKEEKTSSTPALMKMKAVDAMHEMDGTKDGYVSREEFMKFHDALFQRMDRNRDGRLSEAEFTDRG